MDLKQRQESQLHVALTALLKRLKVILVSSDFIFTEFFNGLFLLLWGAWIALPYWSVFNTTPTFSAMAGLPVHENVQGFIIMCVGLSVLWGIFTGNKRLRKASIFWSVLIWAFISAMFINANYQSTATITYPMLALSGAWAYWRITVTRE